MHENAIFSPRRGGIRRVRPMLDPPLRWMHRTAFGDCSAYSELTVNYPGHGLGLAL